MIYTSTTLLLPLFILFVSAPSALVVSVIVCGSASPILARFASSNICLSCVLQEEVVIEQESHHHPLMLVSRSAKFSCDVCCTKAKDKSY
ncbi:hypothetical protein LguiA_024642 [Lonicera macranthoides]